MSTAAESLNLRPDNKTLTIAEPETLPTIEELRAQFAAGIDWPERPTCHDGAWHASSFGETHWRPPFGRRPASDEAPEGTPASSYDENYRTCSYCGSMHPENLTLVLLGTPPAHLGGADWKYGWPHKFYIDNIPNPAVGLPASSGGESGPVYEDDGKTVKRDAHGHVVRYYKPHIAPAPATMMAKWYNEHFLDLSEPTFLFMSALVEHFAHVRFLIKDGGLCYRAPYRGFQAGY